MAKQRQYHTFSNGEKKQIVNNCDRQGVWETITTSCSGCFETVDGQPVGDYPWDAVAGCHIGAGCSECGYTGKQSYDSFFTIEEYEQGIQAYEDAKMSSDDRGLTNLVNII